MFTLQVNGHATTGMTHREVAEYIKHAPDTVQVFLHRPLNPGWKVMSREESWSDFSSPNKSAELAHEKSAELAPIIEHQPTDIGWEETDQSHDFDNQSHDQSSDALPVIVEPVKSDHVTTSFTEDNDILSSVSEPHLLSVGVQRSADDDLNESKSETTLVESVMDELKDVGVFTVQLKKGFRGLGFMLDKSLSGQEGN